MGRRRRPVDAIVTRGAFLDANGGARHGWAVPLHEIRPARIWYLVALVPTLGLTAFILYWSFGREVDPADELPTHFKLMMAGMAGIGVLLSGSFAYRFVRQPAIFSMDEEGFSYAPGGVSTGLIRWADVVELKEEGVLEGDTGGTRISAALAVVLRNPDEYIARFPRVLRPLFIARGQLNSSPLMLNIADFGADYPRVKALMEEQIRRQPGLR